MPAPVNVPVPAAVLAGTVLLASCTEPHPCFAPPLERSCPGAQATGTTTEPTSSTTDPRPDLLVWYRFEDEPLDPIGAIDASGNGLDAACSQNCPLRIEGVDGRAMFNDEERFVTVAGDDFVLDALTLAAWVRDDTEPGDVTTNMFLAKPYLADSENSYRFYTGDFDDDGVRDLIFRIGVEDAQTVFTDFTPRLGQWTHVAATWDGLQMVLYVGGEPVDTGPAPNIDYDDQPLVVGADLNAFESDNYWEGALDEVRVYTRALAADEVAQLAR